MNKVFLIGHLGKDPEVKRLQSGDSVCNFSIATSSSYKDKSGKKQDAAEWHNIVVFGQLADSVGSYLKKGSHVAIEGKIQTRSWEDKQGQKKYTTEINASSVEFLDKKSASVEQTDDVPF